ncbi:MAG: hypothetical protein LUF87_00280 [Alistipes sp.]|nr:hypothetical protein [Alistipes sp.]
MSKELDAVSGMFEEQMEMIKQILKNQQTTGEINFNPEQLAEVRELSEAVKKAARNPDQTVIHNHKHRIVFPPSDSVIWHITLITLIVILGFLVKRQHNTLIRFEDNDLKYRYIEMRGSAEPEEILMLREIFDYNRNKEQIRVIRQKVNQYEKLIREQAETEARARLNAAEAERLRNEAETVKGK